MWARSWTVTLDTYIRLLYFDTNVCVLSNIFKGKVQVTSSTGKKNNITLSGDSYVHIAVPDDAAKDSIFLNGQKRQIILRDKQDHNSVTIDGLYRTMSLRNHDQVETVHIAGAGKIFLRDNNGKFSIILDGSGQKIILQDVSENETILLGGDSRNIILRDGSGSDSITLDGDKGDIVLGNADCAEDFDISDPLDIEPGTVVVLDEKGKLQANSKPYDKKVAGVISGAGDSKPGLVLDKKHSQNNRRPVGLMGKVYCKVDADSSPIEVGDMLTTSFTPGHAMKAEDPFRAFGAVIGKALQSIRSGKGLIPILISLQ